MTQITSIHVSYKRIDEWHVFSSTQLAGLYIASKDAERAYDDVKVAIKKLVKLNLGLECKVVPELPFSDFLSKAQARKNPSLGSVPMPRVFESQRYALEACA